MKLFVKSNLKKITFNESQKNNPLNFNFMDKLLHIIPAAGKASRIGGIPKFLLQ